LRIKNSTWKRYRFFGVNLYSDFEFKSPQHKSNFKPDLVFSKASSSFLGENDFKQYQKVFASPYLDERGLSKLYLFHSETEKIYVMHFTGIADFYIKPNLVLYYLIDPTKYWMLEILFLSTVISFILELRGFLVLHASAVAIKNSAIAFLSNSGNGKSTLAAAMMKSNAQLISDDILPVKQRKNIFFGVPGYPQIRLWPDEPRNFLIETEQLNPVNLDTTNFTVTIDSGQVGKFCQKAKRIACLYIPQRRKLDFENDLVEISPVSQSEAIIYVLRFSFVPRIIEAVGYGKRRLESLTKLVSSVPVRSISYPSGLDRLSKITEVIMGDLEKLVTSR